MFTTPRKCYHLHELKKKKRQSALSVWCHAVNPGPVEPQPSFFGVVEVNLDTANPRKKNHYRPLCL